MLLHTNFMAHEFQFKSVCMQIGFIVRMIANTFFRAGFIEAWGRGIEKIWNYKKRRFKPKREMDYSIAIFHTIQSLHSSADGI